MKIIWLNTVLCICIVAALYYKCTQGNALVFDSSISLNQGNAAPKLILCIGDSITRGSGASKFSYEDYDFNEDLTSYPSVLNQNINKYYGTKNRYKVLNFGLRGATAQKPTGNSRSYWESLNFTNSLSQKNVLVIVMQFGTNDAKKQYWNETRFMEDYSDLISEFKSSYGNPRIFLNIPPPLVHKYAETNYGMSASIINNKLPELVPKLAKDNFVNTIDIFSALGGHYAFTEYDNLKHDNEFGLEESLNVVLNSTVAWSNTTEIHDKKGTSLCRTSYDKNGNILATVIAEPNGDRSATKLFGASNYFLNFTVPLTNPNDGCHPNDKGYKAMSSKIFKTLLLHDILPDA